MGALIRMSVCEVRQLSSSRTVARRFGSGEAPKMAHVAYSLEAAKGDPGGEAPLV
jgi:hypothetical protein